LPATETVMNIPPALDRWMFANPVSFRGVIQSAGCRLA
jgi:hypothetical protein